MAASFVVRLLIYIAAGAVVGLIIGIALEMAGVIDNPFWGVAAGMLVGSVGVGIATALHDETTQE